MYLSDNCAVIYVGRKPTFLDILLVKHGKRLRDAFKKKKTPELGILSQQGGRGRTKTQLNFSV